jgi:hypothetical protein
MICCVPLLRFYTFLHRGASERTMSNQATLTLLKDIQLEITLPSGAAATERFAGLRDVDAKVRETKQILRSVEGLPPDFIDEMSADQAFETQSRRIRLESLGSYIKSAVRFIESGALVKPEKVLLPAPDVSRLTTAMPNLKGVIDRRWIEAQKCVHAECYTAAVIIMGSILEALMLGRAMLSIGQANQSLKAPKDKTGRILAVHDWNLNSLIEVAIDLRWVKTDRGKFSHALRESRNVVHPWTDATSQANFDLATCRTSWEVLQASISDLLASCN